MDVKFEEVKYEKDDWFVMLLSELIFDQLKLKKPKPRGLKIIVLKL